MKFGIRREISFDKPDYQLDGLAGINIELALPYRMEDFFAGQEELPLLAAAVAEAGCVVQSVHAPQGRLADPVFHNWASATARFAEAVGADVVVFHPENSKKASRLDQQILALQNIKRLHKATTRYIAIETFGGPKRILTPEEIGNFRISMVLDTSHLFPERTMDIIEKYHYHISAVHLSEPRDGRQHMPVEGFGYQVLDMLRAKGWDGIVTLEYLPEYHDRLLPDLYKLQKQYGG